MGRKLYVGNLPYTATDASLREAFGASGTVESATVITDRDTGQSKGFGFVEMSTDQEAQAATQAMNGASLDCEDSFFKTASWPVFRIARDGLLQRAQSTPRG